MSASDKKKLRKEQVAELLSEKQRQEQAEAKKLRIYTIGFLAAMALIVCIVIGVLGVRAVNQSGVFQKNTIAATIGDRELNSVELGYYYNDAINGDRLENGERNIACSGRHINKHKVNVVPYNI